MPVRPQGLEERGPVSVSSELAALCEQALLCSRWREKYVWSLGPGPHDDPRRDVRVSRPSCAQSRPRTLARGGGAVVCLRAASLGAGCLRGALGDGGVGGGSWIQGLLSSRRGSFAPGGASRGHVIPRGGMQGGFGGQNRGSRPSDARFSRRY